MNWLPKSVVCLSYYDGFRFRSDFFAALVLALQIFPAGIAIAIASGLPPLYGISCAAIASFLASVLGDSKIRISAPNVVFVVVASTIVARQGVLSLLLSTLLAGVLLMFLGAIGLGAAVQKLPRPVAAGFSTGIAVLVVSGQLPDILGISQVPIDGALRRSLAAVRHITQLDPHAIILAAATVTLTVVGRKTFRHIPAGLVVIAVGALLVKFGHFRVRTLEGLYGSNLMSFHLHHTEAFRSDLLGAILAQAFAIAVLVAIESLQAITLASSLSGERFNPDGELLVQGAVNVGCAFVGGLPASGTSFYTSENARLGAQTPLAGMLQAIFLAVLLLVVSPLVQFIPLPVISAIILLSVSRMSHWREIPQLIRLTPTEVVAWLAISFLTLAIDLPIAVGISMLISMFLYIRNQRDPGLAKPVKRNAS